MITVYTIYAGKITPGERYRSASFATPNVFCYAKATFSSRAEYNHRKKSRLNYSFFYGTPGTIRTYDLQYRKLTLYPAELRVHNPYIIARYRGRSKPQMRKNRINLSIGSSLISCIGSLAASRSTTSSPTSSGKYTITPG